MKTRIFLSYILLLAACTKTDIRQPENNLNNISGNNYLRTSSPDSIITAHPWKYNAFYMNYVDENHKGDPRYVRGASNNEDQILATDRFLFKSDHHFVQKEGDYIYRGTWRFSDNVPTFLFMKYDWGTNEDSITLFDINHLNFVESFGYGGKIKSYTELIPVR